MNIVEKSVKVVLYARVSSKDQEREGYSIPAQFELLRNYAKKHRIQILEILPEYDLYGRAAPLKRNDWILALSDIIFIFWDGKSHGASYMIKNCRKLQKPMKLFEFIEGKFVLTEEIPLPDADEPDFFKKFIPTVIYE